MEFPTIEAALLGVSKLGQLGTPFVWCMFFGALLSNIWHKSLNCGISHVGSRNPSIVA